MKAAYMGFVGWYRYYRKYNGGCGRIEAVLKSLYWFRLYAWSSKR